MSLILLYAASVAGAFAGWYTFGPIGNAFVRCVARASLIAFLCAPGVLVGHGIGVAPTLFALAVQPSVFTFGSIGIVWLLALAAIGGIPALRRQANGWPPSPQSVFIDGFVGKFLLFGLIYGSVLVAVIEAGDSFVVQVIKYVLFFAGAVINFSLSFYAVRSKQANPCLTPLLFAAPILLGAAPTVSVLWYGGGAVGALLARRRHRLAAWISIAACGLLALNSVERSIRAIDAPPHVTIEGGVTGNAAIAALFIALAALSWWSLSRAGLSSGRDTAGISG
jgi:hypothetical protein